MVGEERWLRWGWVSTRSVQGVSRSIYINEKVSRKFLEFNLLKHNLLANEIANSMPLFCNGARFVWKSKQKESKAHSNILCLHEVLVFKTSKQQTVSHCWTVLITFESNIWSWGYLLPCLNLSLFTLLNFLFLEREKTSFLSEPTETTKEVLPNKYILLLNIEKPMTKGTFEIALFLSVN